MSLLFYTAANGYYEKFIPVYIYFALNNNTNSYVEVGVQDAEIYKEKNKETVNVLRNIFGDRFKITTVDFEDIEPGAVRFITEPTMADQFEHVYIGDVDILILDNDVEEQHVKHMNEKDIQFSNRIRDDSIPESKYYNLSGLHFAPTDVQYPLPNLDQIPYRTYGSDADKLSQVDRKDEYILYKIMEKKGCMIPEEIHFRPQHGIHTRTNTHPFGTRKDKSAPEFSFEEISNGTQINAWSGIHQKQYREQFKAEISAKEFQELYPTLNLQIKTILLILENICNNRFDEFETEAYEYIISESPRKQLFRRGIQSFQNGGFIRTSKKVIRYIYNEISSQS